MDSLAQDIRQSLRSLGARPGLFAVAVLSLALGIGLNTAIFSALNTLLWRPLPLRDPDRTVYVYHSDAAHPDRGTSFPAFEHYRDQTGTFSKTMAFSGARPLLLVDQGRTDQVHAELITSGFFSIADMSLQLGRPFDRDVDRTSDPPLVAVLSDGLWKRRFESDPAIVGKTIMLNGRAVAVSGVAAPGFTGLDPEVSADLWIPLTVWAHMVNQPARLTGEEHWITTMAELKEGVSLAQAQAAMDVTGQSVRSAGDRTIVRSARERSGASSTDALAIGGAAFAIGLLVLGVACLNVTSLLMARAAARQREISVRMALGSSRGRLIRLWLIESLALSTCAAVLGVVLASWTLGLAVAFKPPTFIGQADSPAPPLGFHLDVRVFAFAVGLSVLTALLVGLIAGLHASNPRTMASMKTDRITDRRFAPGFNLRSVVIASQMAVSLVLLIPCGLFVRSWLNASTMSPGFATENVLLLPISSDQAGVHVEKPAGFDQQLIDRVAALPGVESVTAMDPVPLWFGGNAALFSIEGAGGSRETPRLGYSRIAPRYFATLRIPLLRGRDFTVADNGSAAPVAIINEAMARRFWPEGTAIGRQIRDGDDVIEIVGVVRDAKYSSFADSSSPWVYRPLAQLPTENPSLSLAVRGTGESTQLAAGIEREVRALVPAWPAFQFRTLDEGLQLQRQLPRFAATLLGVLGCIGLLLAAVGIYSVMAYVVRQRTQEIGIRLALGAPGRSVIALMIRQGMAVCLTGAAIGLLIALAGTRFLSGLLFGIGAADPLTYAVVPLVLIAVAAMACYLPVRHVSTLSPLEALRRE